MSLEKLTWVPALLLTRKRKKMWGVIRIKTAHKFKEEKKPEGRVWKMSVI